jgi:hypothetical protein
MRGNFSSILVTEEVMSVMFGFWSWRLGDNLIFLTRHSLRNEIPVDVILSIRMTFELTLGVATLNQQHYLNFNLEGKVNFIGDGNVMILRASTFMPLM